jgi:hypothetical protein
MKEVKVVKGVKKSYLFLKTREIFFTPFTTFTSFMLMS